MSRRLNFEKTSREKRLSKNTIAPTTGRQKSFIDSLQRETGIKLRKPANVEDARLIIEELLARKNKTYAPKISRGRRPVPIKGKMPND